MTVIPVIRSYQQNDKPQILSLLIYLQEYERTLEPEEKNRGEDIAEEFLTGLLAENNKKQGQLLVAEIEGKIAGFINMWVEDESDEEDIVTKTWLYISDLAVLPDFQSAGIGSQLLKTAENYAKKLKLTHLHIGVLAKNENARNFYDRCGFREFELTLIKRLA